MSLAIAATAIMAYGALRNGMAQKASADYNAEVLTERAKQEGIKASIIGDKIRRAKTRMEGTQTAGYAKAGVRIEGTPLSVLVDTATQYEEDIAVNDYNKRVAQAGYTMGAEAEEIKGREATLATALSIGGTILSGASARKATSAGSSYLGTDPYTTYGSWE